MQGVQVVRLLSGRPIKSRSQGDLDSSPQTT
jgi:hypothetical protein